MNSDPNDSSEEPRETATKEASSAERLNVRALVKKLIEADGIDDEGLPDGFEDIDAVAFTKELARYREKAVGTSRYRNKIRTSAWSDPSNANAIIEVLCRAQPDVTGKVMSAAIGGIEISLDYGVMGGDVFMPRIMPNGAVLFRNHHRVIGIDESASLRIEINKSILREELIKVAASIEVDESDSDSVGNFSIIHRDQDGTIVRTRNVPEELSSWGQTLILIDGSVDLSASPLLNEAGISSVCANSRTGTAVVRVFEGSALVYGTYRASDEFDTILEEYSSHSFYESDSPSDIEISQDRKKIASIVAQRILDHIDNGGLNRPKEGVMRYYFDEMMLSPDNWSSYACAKAAQISSFAPMFHESPNQPVHYYAPSDPFWRMSEEFDHKIAVIEAPLQAFRDIDDFEKNFKKIIKTRLLGDVGLAPRRLFLVTEDPSPWQGKESAYDLDSKHVKAWIKAQASDMRSQLSAAMEQDPDQDAGEAAREILLYGSLSVRLVLEFDERPDYIVLNGLMKQMSKSVDGGGNLSVPYVGFSQGYDCGDYDTGNANALIPTDQYEGAGDDEDDTEECDDE